jgi:phosphatidylserine/phosphatidylglycerophosphate/cardiolipin synthase-like enzyme
MIFRFDQHEVELALESAVTRGVSVRALIAFSSRGGEKGLRSLESRLRSTGVAVTRTADDLTRYHSKLMIIDRRVLYLMTFNCTRLDIDRSRSFGLVTGDELIVREAVRLFEADTDRRPYNPRLDDFVVSPINARKRLTAFIKGAKRQLLIYDGKLTDPEIVRLLRSHAKAGVEVRVIGRRGDRRLGTQTVHLASMRLHAQAIIRDGSQAFLGSQSLRKVELDARREVGLITRAPAVVTRLLAIFESDWFTCLSMKNIPTESAAGAPAEITAIQLGARA